MKKKVKTPVVPEPVASIPLHKDLFSDRRIHLLILVTVSLALYFNSIFSGYVLDDMIVITHNSFTQKGFAGIKDLLFHDSFLGFTGMENQLAGGRYRPLSMVTFAMEYGLFGLRPHITHFINVLLYAALIGLLYRFLDRFVFKQKPFISFLVALLFAIHPIHTEVVANIKSRDELMCMIFLLLSMELLFRHVLEKKNPLQLAGSLFMFFLSLLSKENGLVYIAVVPLLLYYFNGVKPGKALRWGIPFFLVIVAYFLIRVKLTGFNMVQNMEVLNAPFLYADKSRAFATKVAVLGKYLIMLVFPYNMSYDYSYNQIKYISLSDARFILSFLVNAGLLVYAFLTFGKRSLISFSILFYFISMALVTNFVFDVGTPFADRFLFQPSLALALILGSYLGNYFYTAKKEEVLQRKKMILVIMAGVLLLAGGKTIARNADWESEATLFLEDVKTCPNSAKTNNNCGVSLINLSSTETNETRKKQLLDEAVEKLKKSVAIHPKYVDAYLNLGVAYSRLNDLPNTEAAWVRARDLSPNHPKLRESLMVLGDLYAMQGFNYNKNKNYQEAVKSYTKAVEFKGRNEAEALYNLGGNYLMLGDVQKAKELWLKVLEINPNHPEAKKWLGEISKSSK